MVTPTSRQPGMRWRTMPRTSSPSWTPSASMPRCCSAARAAGTWRSRSRSATPIEFGRSCSWVRRSTCAAAYPSSTRSTGSPTPFRATGREPRSNGSSSPCRSRPGYIDDRVEDAVRTPAHAWKLALYGLADAEPPTLRRTITAPTLIIHGGRDELLPEDTGRRLADAIPASRLLVYRDAAHLVLWEHPERIARDVTEFMAGLPEQESRP